MEEVEKQWNRTRQLFQFRWDTLSKTGPIFEKYQEFLLEYNNRTSGGLLRCDSNDYLGLSSIRYDSTDPNDFKLISNGFHNTTAIVMEMQSKLESLLGFYKVYITNSCYSANESVLQTLCCKGLNIYCDQYVHKSITASIEYRTDINMIKFLHNNMINLENLIKKHGAGIIITEGVFSHNGTKSPLNIIIDIKKKYNCYLWIDESHSLGVYGNNGSGICSELNYTKYIDILTASLSKAWNTHAGLIACTKKFSLLLRGGSIAKIFTTTTTPLIIKRFFKIYNIMNSNIGNEKRNKLKYLTNYSSECIKEYNLLHLIEYPIKHPIITFPKFPSKLSETIGLKLRQLFVKKYGIVIFVMYAPAYTYPYCYIRCTLNANMNKNHIKKLFKTIKEVDRLYIQPSYKKKSKL